MALGMHHGSCAQRLMVVQGMVTQQTTASGSITLNGGSSVVSRLQTDAGAVGGRLGSLGPTSSSVVAHQGSLQHAGSLVQAPSLACSVSAPHGSDAQRRVASVASLSSLQAAASAQAASPPQPQTLAAMQQHQVCRRPSDSFHLPSPLMGEAEWWSCPGKPVGASTQHPPNLNLLP